MLPLALRMPPHEPLLLRKVMLRMNILVLD
jgi:hypothetical protein